MSKLNPGTRKVLFIQKKISNHLLTLLKRFSPTSIIHSNPNTLTASTLQAATKAINPSSERYRQDTGQTKNFKYLSNKFFPQMLSNINHTDIFSRVIVFVVIAQINLGNTSLCTKMKPQYPRYQQCILMLVHHWGSESIQQQEGNGPVVFKFPPIHLPCLLSGRTQLSVMFLSSFSCEITN